MELEDEVRLRETAAPDARSTVLVFGEALVDRFPDGSERMGGAPFNVAWHLRGLGMTPRLQTRIGADEAGQRLTTAMTAWGLDLRAVQVDHAQPTGAVQVHLREGEPSFEILPDQAYDRIEPSSPAILRGIGALYHGTLAARDPCSLRTLLALRRRTQVPVFCDVNLRAPWWERDGVHALIRGTQWLKLNEAELEALWPAGRSTDARLAALQELAGASLVILTRGKAGALVRYEAGTLWTVEPPTDEHVVDAVGAGDAFAAVALVGLLRGWAPPLWLTRAQQLASRVVGIRGAVPVDPRFYHPLRDLWRLP